MLIEPTWKKSVCVYVQHDYTRFGHIDFNKNAMSALIFFLRSILLFNVLLYSETVDVHSLIYCTSIGLSIYSQVYLLNVYVYRIYASCKCRFRFAIKRCIYINLKNVRILKTYSCLTDK